VKKQHNVLEIHHLSVSYGPVKVLKDICLEVDREEIVALIGPNGAGKTSLLNAILSIQRPDSGSILFQGSDITNKPTDKIVSSGICLIPEGHGIFPSMSVWENLQLGAYHNQHDSDKNLRRVFAWFPILHERSSQIAETLSGGEQQMLAIGRALMSGPKLIMVDEPSLGLAPKIVADIFDIIVELNNEDYTILLAEQNARKSLECAHRGYVIELGRVVLEGNSKQLMNNERVRKAYLGGSV
jgi:branched-chain amino acid transport system ATP-binding protein